MTPPDPGAAFRWDHTTSGPVLRCTPLEAVAHHAFTSRQLQLRGDQPEGWVAAAATVGCPLDRVRRVRQVHGATVHVVQDATPDSAPRPPADALATRTPGLALTVVTADCVPILLADPASGAVAAVHAGWRGTAADVAGAAVRALGREFGVAPAGLIAAIGPSIGACCYEVGEELLDAFASAGHDSAARADWFSRDDAGRLRLDLLGGQSRPAGARRTAPRPDPRRRVVHQDPPGLVRVLPRRRPQGWPPGGRHRRRRSPRRVRPR